MKYEIMIKILFLLLAKNKVSAQYIAKRFEISKRTVMRYIDAISLAGIPVLSDTGRNGGYYIANSYKLPVGFLTEGELSSVVSVLKTYNETLLNADISSAIDKLSATKRSDSGLTVSCDNVIIDYSSWLGNSTEQRIVSLISEAVEKGLVVNVSYKDKNGNSTVRDIEPHVIILKQGIFYTYAYCRTRQDFRIFKLARIAYANLTDEKFTKRETGDISSVLQELSDSLITEYVDLIISPNVIAEAEEWLGAENVYKNQGEYFASRPLPIDGLTVSKILSFGGQIKVISPKKLKDAVISSAENIIKQYEK